MQFSVGGDTVSELRKIFQYSFSFLQNALVLGNIACISYEGVVNDMLNLYVVPSTYHSAVILSAN